MAAIVYPPFRGKGWKPGVENYTGHLPLKHDGILTRADKMEIFTETGCTAHVRPRRRGDWQKVLAVHCLMNDEEAIAKLNEAVQKAEQKIYSSAMAKVTNGEDGQPLRVPKNLDHHGVGAPPPPARGNRPQKVPAPDMMVQQQNAAIQFQVERGGGNGGMGLRVAGQFVAQQ